MTLATVNRPTHPNVIPIILLKISFLYIRYPRKKIVVKIMIIIFIVIPYLPFKMVLDQISNTKGYEKNK